MGDEIIDVDLAVHVPVDDLRHIGTATGATEGGTLTDAPGHQLEGTGGDFLAGAGDADDDGDAPALVAAFQRLAHHGGITDAFEAVIGATLGEVDEIGNEIALNFLRV